MKIAICEDSDDDRLTLCNYIADYCSRMGYLCEISMFETGEALLESFSPGAFELVLLDIGLPGISGIETARQIRASDRDCTLMFTTISAEHTVDSYSLYAIGYVIKPYKQDNIDNALHLCRGVWEKTARTIKLPLVQGDTLTLPVNNIQYAEIHNRVVRLHMHRGSTEAKLKLGELEAMLGGGPFLRCHYSYLVNMNHIGEVGEADFKMKNGAFVPIRKNGRKEIKIMYAKFLAGRTAREV